MMSESTHYATIIYRTTAKEALEDGVNVFSLAAFEAACSLF